MAKAKTQFISFRVPPNADKQVARCCEWLASPAGGGSGGTPMNLSEFIRKAIGEKLERHRLTAGNNASW